MLEQIPHLQIVDAVGVQVYIGHRLDDGEKPVAGVELFDLVGKFEALEDSPRGGGKSVDVGNEVGRDVLGVAEQPLKGERAGIVEPCFLRFGSAALLRRLSIALSGFFCAVSLACSLSTACLVGSRTQSSRRSTTIGSMTSRYCGGR
nr:hypothetical protein [Mesorhizobium escarrei]